MPGRSASIAMLAALTGLGAALHPARGEESPSRDVTFFLRRLRTLDHLPEPASSHTAMSSTWDRSGLNADGTDFKCVEGTRNVLLDVDGPGCVHRVFVGRLGDEVTGTRIQVILDKADSPLLDMPVDEFFDDHHGPFAYPLVFHKTYPGMLFPIPFASHCRIQLVNPSGTHWGRFWQVTYTRLPAGESVKSLTWPLSSSERAELALTCDTWLRAESQAPDDRGLVVYAPEKPLAPGAAWDLTLPGSGTIRQLRFAPGRPLTSEVLAKLRLQIRWDGEAENSVDVPFSSFFGEIDEHRRSETRFNSLVMGATEQESYCCLPMPFTRGARIRIDNGASVSLEGLAVRLGVDRHKPVPADHGRLRATFKRHQAGVADSPRCGPQQIPAHAVLDVDGPGKYVGVLLVVDWPYEEWWGEGDWLIWTDETGWPPSYHGTGSEEYFNSGWCRFDRKAVSGYIATHPGIAAQYSFHLNDAFCFREHIRVMEETTGFDRAKRIIEQQHPFWSSTAFWYAPAKPPAGTAFPDGS